MTFTTNFELERNAHGQLVLIAADGARHAGVVPVRAFPVAAPEEGVSLVAPDGHELAWVPHITELPVLIRRLVEDELASREFMPEIRRLRKVSSFATPSIWEVDTDRGSTSFVLKGEEDIRRLSPSTLLVADSHGVQFLIRDLFSLDRYTRRLLDRFL